MKKILLMILFLAIIIPFFGKAQESINNFHFNENVITWQKIFETDLEWDKLVSVIKESGVIKDIDLKENKIMGQSNLIEPDYKGAGYKEMMIPMYIARSFVNAFIVIEFKEGKYRVTLKNILLTQKYDDSLSKVGEKTSLETYAIKRKTNEIKMSFAKSPSNILDYTFSNSFDFKMNEKNDDW